LGRGSLFSVIEATPTEKEAVLLRWRAQNPNAPADGRPTDEEAAELLREIRDRASAIESQAMELLKKQMKIRPAPAPAKQQSAISFLVIVAAIIIAAFIYAIVIRR